MGLKIFKLRTHSLISLLENYAQDFYVLKKIHLPHSGFNLWTMVSRQSCFLETIEINLEIQCCRGIIYIRISIFYYTGKETGNLCSKLLYPEKNPSTSLRLQLVNHGFKAMMFPWDHWDQIGDPVLSGYYLSENLNLLLQEKKLIWKCHYSP